MPKAKKFNKTAYFNLVKEIAKDVRTRKSLSFRYCRLFSEPRIKTNYRTKFWLSNSGAKKAAGYINKKYGKKVTAVVEPIPVSGYMGHYINNDLVLRPKQ
jgi:hypothetical protein